MGGSGGGNGGSLGEVGGEGNGVRKYARTKPKGSFINDVTQRGSLGKVGGEGNWVRKYARTKPKGSFINDVTQRGGEVKENFRDVIYECPLTQCQCPTLNYSC